MPEKPPKAVTNFDVMNEMCNRNLDIRLAPIGSNVISMKTTNKGQDTRVEIGVVGNIITKITVRCAEGRNGTPSSGGVELMPEKPTPRPCQHRFDWTEVAILVITALTVGFLLGIGVVKL